MLSNIFQQRPAKFLVFLLMFLFSYSVLAETDEEPLTDDSKLFEKANQFTMQQQWQQAEPIYRGILERNRQWPEPGNNLAVLLLKTGRLDEARQMLEQSVRSSPSYKIAQKNRTLLFNYLATQAYDKALGAEQTVAMPELELIPEINQPVRVIEKKVEVVVEKIIEVEKPAEEILTPDENILSQKNILSQISQQLLVWSTAWSEGNFNDYIAAYSTEFVPSDSQKSYTEWKNIRRARLKFTKGVEVNIEQLRVFLETGGEFALVEFLQNYHSASYSDQVLKQLYMRHQKNNKWLILSERIIKTY